MSDPVVLAFIGFLGTSGVAAEIARRLLSRRRGPTLKERLEQVERTQRYTLDYVEVLRSHLSNGNPPPPPPWPAHLTLSSDS